MDLHALLRDLVLILAISVPVVAGLRRLGVPTIAGFVLAGALVGPGALGLIVDPHKVDVLAEIGVVLLLFGIGMELSPAKLLRMWRPTLIGGSLQVGLTLAATAALASVFGLSWSQGMVLGFLVALSSTAVVLRVLALRGESETPHGRWILGVLLFQDLAVVPMMLALPLLAGSAPEIGAGAWLGLLGRVVPVLVGVLVAGTLIVPRLLAVIARTRARELFILTVLLIGVGTAWLTSLAGVSLALGAFLAGTVVAGSNYRHQALADLVPTREVFTSLFFVSVGMLLDPSLVVTEASAILGLLAAVLIGKGLVVGVVALLLSASRRAVLQSAVALSGLGEFAFVLLRGGASEVLGATLTERLVAVAILSMLATPALLSLASRFAWRRLPEVDHEASEGDPLHGSHDNHVIVAGFGVVGEQLCALLKRLRQPHLVLDLNADNVRRARRLGHDALFGDASRRDLLEHLDLARAREMVILISDTRAVLQAVREARHLAPDLHIIARTRFVDEAEQLRVAGASIVVTEEGEAGVGVLDYLLGRRGHSRDAANPERAILRGLAKPPAPPQVPSRQASVLRPPWLRRP